MADQNLQENETVPFSFPPPPLESLKKLMPIEVQITTNRLVALSPVLASLCVLGDSGAKKEKIPPNKPNSKPVPRCFQWSFTRSQGIPMTDLAVANEVRHRFPNMHSPLQVANQLKTP